MYYVNIDITVFRVDNATATYHAPAVGKAFRILQLISKSDDGAGLSELAEALEMSKGTVHGVVSALEDLGAVLRDPRTRKFTLGFTLFELGKRAYSQIDLKDLARPVLEDLMEKTRETAYLGVLNGMRITILDVVESRQDLKITSPKGSNIPLFAGATGKVMLASMEEEQSRTIIMQNKIPRFTENSITDPELYMREVREAKESGVQDRAGRQGNADADQKHKTGSRRDHAKSQMSKNTVSSFSHYCSSSPCHRLNRLCSIER